MQFRLISVLGAGGGICSRLGIQAGRNCASSGQPDRAARWVFGLTKFPHKKNLFEETFGCMVRVWTLR